MTQFRLPILLLTTLATGLILSVTAADAQPMRIKFDLGTPYENVLEKLRKEKGIEILSEAAGDDIEIVENIVNKGKTELEIFYTFEFKEGKLSATTVNSTYEKLSPAKKIFDEYREYVFSLGAEPLEFYTNPTYQRYIAVISGKPTGTVYGLQFKMLDEEHKSNIQIRVSIASCTDCPK